MNNSCGKWRRKTKAIVDMESYAWSSLYQMSVTYCVSRVNTYGKHLRNYNVN